MLVEPVTAPLLMLLHHSIGLVSISIIRENAKGNLLAKRLKEVGVNPRTSNFRMLALGPFFSEQATFDKHKPFRDQMATYEHELANYLKTEGYNVLGSHHIGTAVENEMLGDVKSQLLDFISGP